MPNLAVNLNSMPKTTIFFGALLLLLTACDLINPAEDAPAFLTIKKFVFEDNLNAKTVEIPDVWVTVNGNFLGSFEFKENGEITIPVLSSGETDIRLEPGVYKDGGYGAIHVSYPYYTPYIEKINLVQEETYTVNPVTSYLTNSGFIEAASENFESILASSYQPCNGCPVRLQYIGVDSLMDPSINESAIGFAQIEQGSTNILDISTKEIFVIPSNAAQVWLEVDYRSDIQFTAAIIFQIGGSVRIRRVEPFFPANPDGWRKVYLDLSDDVSDIADFAVMQLRFYSLESDGAKPYYVALDNIRLVVPD
jgi:hypothetical protein